MRYTTQFEIEPYQMVADKNVDARIEYEKKRNCCNLGNIIGANVGFEKLPFDEIDRWRLEVQVFPEKEWDEFKLTLMYAIQNMSDLGLGDKNWKDVKALIKKLENIGAKSK